MINANITVYELSKQHPAAFSLFLSKGFDNFKDDKTLASAGKFLKLETAIKQKNYDVQTFLNSLAEIEKNNDASVDVTLKEQTKKGDITLKGLLPCPVRLPLLEKIDSFANEVKEQTGLSVAYDFIAAAQGQGWLEENVVGIKAENVPDLFVSAGFDVFFDERSFGQHVKNGMFEDMTGECHDYLAQMKDPRGNYGMVGVVPAVFMVNLDALGEREVPKSWADILSPAFENSVSLPVGDFDLFNSLLVHIHHMFGDEGVEKLAKSMIMSMHPAQMVKNAGKKTEAKPAVTIMPYFFTKMLFGSKSVAIVWPEEGSIVSPVFMLTRKDRKDIIKPAADFLYGKETGEIMAHKGLFPVLNKEVDNRLPADAKFCWMGWDAIYATDMGSLLERLNSLFNSKLEA
ncbi:ABC transporter substrate-binding protein [Seleniivibrio woodruffii]|uniref:ABC transporter substrate-binding protein n=1 Tax=Seleniivibrio woodruffii TaxID=1078050 RepID=UPI0039E22ADE